MPRPRTAALLATTMLTAALAACSDTGTPADGSDGSTTAAASASTDRPASGEPPQGDASTLVDTCESGSLIVDVAGGLPGHLTSVSGLAGSWRHPGVIWAVEDSFEPAEVVALDPQGGLLATVRVTGDRFVMNLDWEAVAIGPGPDGEPWLHIADIGDNLGIRSDVQIHRVPEADLRDHAVAAETVTVRYDDGARRNAEAMAVDPDGTIWIVDKEPDGPATIFRLDDDGVLRPRGTIDLPGEQVTALDASADGSTIALRTNERLRLYRVADGADVAAALSGAGCETPPLDERQGESVAFLGDGTGLVTVSEDESGGEVDLHLTRPR